MSEAERKMDKYYEDKLDESYEEETISTGDYEKLKKDLQEEKERFENFRQEVVYYTTSNNIAGLMEYLTKEKLV
ncbi:MAG: hypothetical protein J6J11_01820 [Treponema sp.]|nr:hypothetical protein [Clostridia bacterium]MBP3607042.1 hypothetical protein [Treponema sp.]